MVDTQWQFRDFLWFLCFYLSRLLCSFGNSEINYNFLKTSSKEQMILCSNNVLLELHGNLILDHCPSFFVNKSPSPVIGIP